VLNGAPDFPTIPLRSNRCSPFWTGNPSSSVPTARAEFSADALCLIPVWLFSALFYKDARSHHLSYQIRKSTQTHISFSSFLYPYRRSGFSSLYLIRHANINHLPPHLPTNQPPKQPNIEQNPKCISPTPPSSPSSLSPSRLPGRRTTTALCPMAHAA
jgi:hypothetical protein